VNRVAVIGGGIVGAGIAYHLAHRGARGVLLFEAAAVGQASTRHSIGGIRSVFADRLEVALSTFSLRAFHELETQAGADFGFRACGYLLLAISAARRRMLLAAAAQAGRQGVPVDVLSRRGLARLIPGVVTADVTAAVLSSADGWMPDPSRPAVAYASLAARRGVTILEHTRVARIRPAGRGFVIESGSRRWPVDCAVLAVNAYAQTLLRALKVHLPCHPYPRHAFAITPPPRGLNPAMPVTVFQDEDILLRADGPGLTAVCGLRERSTQDLALAAHRRREVRRRLARRIDLNGKRVQSAFSGLRGMTPDRRALVGPVPGLPGLWCAIGFSGHGFMHAPAIAHAVADVLLRGRCEEFDLSPLDPGRFGDIADAPPVLEQRHY
jgi:sarcosine oxidase subunit beta